MKAKEKLRKREDGQLECQRQISLYVPVRARWHGGVDSGQCLVWCLVVVVVAPGAPELRCAGVAWCGAARQKLAESAFPNV